jgi:hypothetical protein
MKTIFADDALIWWNEQKENGDKIKQIQPSYMQHVSFLKVIYFKNFSTSHYMF